MNKWKKAAALTLCLCFLSCTAVQAAESASGNIDYSAVFDAEYYYNTYQDVQQTIGFNEEDLLDHFIRSGMAEGRMGKADFDVRSYMKNNLDLLAVYGIKDLSAYYYHYIQSGKAEGRTVGYPSRNADEIAPFSTRIVSNVGGGICQVSSTLYVAMTLSSIPATERYAHSLAVDYVPKGLDSAIVEGVKDLRFKNLYDYPIRIDSSAENGTLTVAISKAES